MKEAMEYKMVYTIKETMEWSVYTEKNEKWVPARPINYKYESIFFKIKCAWKVFRGEYDCLKWD